MVVGALDHREYVVSKMAKQLVKPPNDDVGQSIDGQWGDSQPADRGTERVATALWPNSGPQHNMGLHKHAFGPPGPVCAQSVREIRDKISYLSHR